MFITARVLKNIQKLKNTIGGILFFVPNRLAKNRVCFRIFNYLYERAPVPRGLCGSRTYQNPG